MTTLTPPAPASVPEPTVRQVAKNLHLINETKATRKTAILMAILMCFVFGISEAVTAQNVLLDFTRLAWVSWLLAIAITTSANFASYYAGSKWHSSKAASIAVGATWLLVGAVLVYLRLRHSEIASPPVTFGQSVDTGAENTAAAGVGDQAQAAILGALYLLGGIVTALKGYTINRPDVLAHITTVEAEQIAVATRNRHAAEHTQASGQLASRYNQIDETNTLFANQRASIAHTIALAKHHSRQRIIELLGDPKNSGGAHIPLLPTPENTPAQKDQDAGSAEKNAPPQEA